MNFEEHAAKPLLAAAGIPVPEGQLAGTPAEAAEAARRLLGGGPQGQPGGTLMVKAQVPAGKRGKAGGILPADSPEQAAEAAAAILAIEIGGHAVERVWLERRADVAHELYAAVLTDPDSKGPLVMVSAAGGMDIEEVAATRPQALRRHAVDIRAGLDEDAARALLAGLELPCAPQALAAVLVALYRVWREHDLELLEINPLAVLADGRLMALDCKLVLDDSGAVRQGALAAHGALERLTGLEERGQALDLKYIELDGDIGVLANGAGLTMTTMDVIAHHGGRAANFLEIGGEAYTRAQPALELLLDNHRVKSLVVNFCGAFARTDVMTAGVIDAWQALSPDLPVYFCVHGTGAAEARVLLRERLGVTPFDTMDEAIRAAIAAPGARTRAEGGP